MDFNHLQLTDQQIEELYSSHLVITEPTAATQPVVKAKTSTVGITGKNGKQFVWVVNEPDYPFLSDEDFQFLSEVISACKMNMDDISLVNIAQNNLAFDDLYKQLQPKILITSFLDQNWLPVSAESYTLKQQPAYQLYCTEALYIIRNDKAKKSKLWLALKQMLGL